MYSYIGGLKREEIFAVNGMKLHEHYFPLLGGDGVPSGAILKMIEEDFGLYGAWKEDFVATGMSARGWAILATITRMIGCITMEWTRRTSALYGTRHS